MDEENIKDQIADAMGLEIRYTPSGHKYYAEIDDEGHAIAMSDIVGRVYNLFIELNKEETK